MSKFQYLRFTKPGAGIIVLTALLLVIPYSESMAQVGKPTTFSFLRLEPSAASASLGGSVVAVPGDDISSFLYNPARLSSSMTGTVSLTYLNHLSDVTSGLAAYVHSSEELSTTFAGAIRYMSWGTLEGADELGQSTGEFGAGNLAASVSASRMYDANTSYGVTIHYIRSDIASYSASALAFDAGASYTTVESGLTVAASLSNLGFTMSSLGETSDELPMDLRLGVAKQLQHLPLMLSLSFYNLTDFDRINADASRLDDVLHHIVVGGEFQFGSSFNARLGYNHRRHDELKTKSRLDFAGFSMGAGIEVKSIRVDYARSSWSENGSLNQFTVSTKIR